ncbi:MAG: MATE family efflux transporter [Clostridia bacterium]|nr:MATE family efflux transporter [Clostridia bacterium]
MLKKDVNMLSGSILKGLLTIAMPIMVMNVVQSLFNVIDMTILKSFDSGSAVGAVGTCGTLISLITGLLIGISSGANVVIARHIGAGELDQTSKATGNAIALSLAGGVLLLIIGLVFAPLFLSWTNCPAELFSQAVLYFRLYFLGAPILMFYNFCASVLRSTGDSKRPMIFLTIGGVVKILFALLFVACFDWGVRGVAWATILSWSVSAVLALYALIHTKSVVHLHFRYVRFYKQETLEMLRIGVPAGLQQAMYSMANVIITATVNTFGAAATTGISIANNFDGILYQISYSPALAVMPYVSQNIGGKNIHRATRAVLFGILITTALGATFGALSAIFSAQLSSIMSDSPEVIAFSQQKMVIISSTYFICGINEILGAGLRGMGKPTVPAVATFLFMCVTRFLWVWFVFPFCPNLTFLYLVWPVSWVLSIVFLLPFYIKNVRKFRLEFAPAT